MFSYCGFSNNESNNPVSNSTKCQIEVISVFNCVVLKLLINHLSEEFFISSKNNFRMNSDKMGFGMGLELFALTGWILISLGKTKTLYSLLCCFNMA